MKLIIVILLLIFLTSISGLIWYILYNRGAMLFEILEKRNNQRSDIETGELLKNVDILKSRELMDALVKNKLIEWQIYNSNPKTENYMGQKEIDSAIEYIIRGVCYEMTPALKLQLGFGYPMDDKDSMVESIKKRAMLIVLEYSIKQNTVSTDNRMMKLFDDD